MIDPKIVTFGWKRSGMGAGDMDFGLTGEDVTLENLRELSHLMITVHGLLLDRIRRQQPQAQMEKNDG